ncbi:cytochrome P450 [Aaosphaeria arxii CBS 175.79]|uniref:Cytochrome P450 n=1 Tax=Aaosphaeria arxii CBS 175.79 TaxID=1450172 RepID=A0A6A5X8X8_9PLEO|nr:cytochrome P450 [Aaosphaeria arxii CBS 175.79]KAF2009336.1 cytochrome P450 [Aaosphaeria arxii CBS 175.79]
MTILNDHPILVAVVVLLFSYVVRVIYNTVQMRRFMRDKPGPPHHPIFGHLQAMGEISQALPKRVHPHVFAYHLQKKYNLGQVFYLDLTPVSDAMIINLSPEAGQDIAQNSGLHKHPKVGKFLDPLLGEGNMVTSDGAQWKKWRSVFNPGFALQHLMTQVPLIVDCTNIYVQNLEKQVVKGEVFRLEDEATKVTIDIIGKVVCDFEFKTLTADSLFLDYMRKALSWMPDTQSFNPFHIYNPIRPLMLRYYKWRLDQFIGSILDERFSTRSTSEPKTRRKAGIDLALESWFKENAGQDVDSKTATMDPEFRKYAINQLNTLVFAGHDTTASTICYAYYLLGKNPSALFKIRAELDSIFGPGVNASSQLVSDPYLINKCEYVLATVKETLRMFGPASTARIGRRDYFIRDPDTGTMFPTDDLLVWTPSSSMGRLPNLWPEPDKFNPDRFMPDNADKVVPNAWRPFEKGPRNCIGQELAMLELKIMLALTIREFDICGAFDELKELEDDGSLWTKDSSFQTGPQQCYGDPAYQVLLAAAKPREGMPVRITKRAMR